MSSDPLPVSDLVEAAIEDTVATASPDAGRWLVEELERRGPEEMWEGALILFGPLAMRPAYGLSGREAVERLRITARTAGPGTALVLEMHRAQLEGGTAAAAAIWRDVDTELRRTAVLHWLISYSWVIGFGGVRLTPAQTVALVRHAIPTTG